MRTIKFRGKRIDNGQWIEGDLVHSTRVLNGVTTYHVLISVDMELEEVDPETVGQFTGLLDKNGKEIWEGDILRIWYGSVNGEDLTVPDLEVRYIGSGFDISTHSHYYEVIGNIHESKPNT